MSEAAGTVDFRQGSAKGKIVRIACEVAAVGGRYRKVHQAMFGFSSRRLLGAARQSGVDLAGAKLKLADIEEDSKRLRRAVDDIDPHDLPKPTDAAHRALGRYADALSATASKLAELCNDLYREGEDRAAGRDHDTDKYRRHKAAYDASMQELKRWGVRLTGLFNRK